MKGSVGNGERNVVFALAGVLVPLEVLLKSRAPPVSLACAAVANGAPPRLPCPLSDLGGGLLVSWRMSVHISRYINEYRQ